MAAGAVPDTVLTCLTGSAEELDQQLPINLNYSLDGA